ncbi:nucleoside transporter, partial [Aphelenchoides avenae]
MDTTPLLGGRERCNIPTNSGWQYRIAVCVFALQGIGFLLPWNVFHIVARPYYIEYTLNGNETQPAYYQDYFFSWLGLFTQVPNLLINVYSVVTAFHGNGVYRIYLCLSTMIGVLAVTLSFVFVDTSAWPEGFFWLTMSSVVLLCTANGLYENSLWGFVADFPPQFVNYVVIGNNVCGVFISLAAIFSITVAPSGNAEIAACIYFSVALGTAVCCLTSFFLLRQM